jgi:putative flippase GtrA
MQKTKLTTLGHSRFFVFVLYGGLNTLATYLLYLLFVTVFNYQIAYLLAYLSGIFLAYILNLRFVFKAQSSLKKAVSYPLIYVIQYFIGALLLYVFVNQLYVSELVAPLLVILILIPISYFLNKTVLLTTRIN